MQGFIRDLRPTYGFIQTDHGLNAFFHIGSLLQPDKFTELRERDRVEFRIAETPRGLRALDVRLIA